MFVYCNNNPINIVDPSGAIPRSVGLSEYDYLLDYAGGAKITGSGTGTSNPGLGTSNDAHALLDFTAVTLLWNVLSQSYARASKRQYRSPLEEHHVVAKASRNASVSASIVNSVLPGGVENPLNKIYVKTGLHRRLHSKVYYGIVNSIIISAYGTAATPSEEKQNVITALCIIRGYIAILDQMAPY